MIKRKLVMCQLKPECLEEYKEYHRNIWPEVVAAYRLAGVSSISCFLNGAQLAIYSEFTEDEARTTNLKSNEMERRWQAIMAPMADSAFKSIDFDEVFHMPRES